MIYRKTAKGQAEIESASRAMPQRLRMVLLLVDGRREDSEIRRMLPAATAQALGELQTMGHIEPLPKPEAPKPGTIAAIGTVLPTSRVAGEASQVGSRFGASSRFGLSVQPRPSRLPPPTEILLTDDQREQIVRSIQRALGPSAEALIRRVEKVRTASELQALLKLTQSAIAKHRGQDLADEFASRYGNLESI